MPASFLRKILTKMLARGLATTICANFWYVVSNASKDIMKGTLETWKGLGIFAMQNMFMKAK